MIPDDQLERMARRADDLGLDYANRCTELAAKAHAESESGAVTGKQPLSATYGSLGILFTGLAVVLRAGKTPRQITNRDESNG